MRRLAFVHICQETQLRMTRLIFDFIITEKCAYFRLNQSFVLILDDKCIIFKDEDVELFSDTCLLHTPRLGLQVEQITV